MMPIEPPNVDEAITERPPRQPAPNETPDSTASDEMDELIVTTGNEVAAFPIRRYLGVVRGIVVRSPSIGQSFLGGINRIVGGNIETYAEVCEAARQEAFDRMVAHAQEIDADAVIAMRYDATEFTSGVTEVLAYGTAVKLAKRGATKKTTGPTSATAGPKRSASPVESEAINCLECGARIPPNQANCPACGWSYNAD